MDMDDGRTPRQQQQQQQPFWPALRAELRGALRFVTLAAAVALLVLVAWLVLVLLNVGP